jgi:hypothetical protein
MDDSNSCCAVAAPQAMLTSTVQTDIQKTFCAQPNTCAQIHSKKQCYPSEGQSYVLHSLNSVQLHCVQLQLHEMPSTAPAMHLHLLLLLLLLLLQQIQTSTRTSTIQ